MVIIDDLTEWQGDKASFSIVATGAMSGNYALEVPATSGVELTSIINDSNGNIIDK